MISGMKKSVATDVAYVAMFCALTIVMGFVAIPVGTAGVPIVIQNVILILAGLVLGGKRGLYVGLLFIGLGLVGLPILAGGRNAITALAGPTAGYIVGYVVSPAVAGAIAYAAPRAKKALALFLALGGAAGLLVQYVFGALGLVVRSGLTITESAAAQVPFLLPGMLEVVAMCVVALGVHTAFPDLMRRRG